MRFCIYCKYCETFLKTLYLPAPIFLKKISLFFSLSDEDFFTNLIPDFRSLSKIVNEVEIRVQSGLQSISFTFIQLLNKHDVSAIFYLIDPAAQTFT